MGKDQIVQRILVVDDEPSIGKALTWGLSSETVEVDVIENGAGGVRLGTQRCYDVVIVDLCLPDIGGLEVVRRIKDRCPNIVAIMVTGKPNSKPQESDCTSEFNVCLEKPLQLQVVKDAIRQGIEWRDRKHI